MKLGIVILSASLEQKIIVSYLSESNIPNIVDFFDQLLFASILWLQPSLISIKVDGIKKLLIGVEKNTHLPIDLSSAFSLISICWSLLQNEKAKSPIDVRWDGIVKLSIDELLKTDFPIIRSSEFAGISALLSILQYEKAQSPIFVTCIGIVNLSIVEALKASLSIVWSSEFLEKVIDFICASPNASYKILVTKY